MAKRQTGSTPQAEGRGQQSPQNAQNAQNAQRGNDAASQGAAGEAGTSSAGGAGRGAGSDQELSRPVSREEGQGSNTGMQRGGARSLGASGGNPALGGRGQGQGQPSLLPAFMANPGLMASAFMTNPFGFAQLMNQEMDRIFETFGTGELGSPLGGSQSGRGLASTGGQQDVQRGVQQGGQQRMQAGGRGGHSHWVPQMELLQRGNELVVRADLPGITPDDVDIEVDDGVLTISGERRHNSEDRQEGFYRSERSYGAFTRSLALPEGVNEEQIGARFEHGVLEVTVPLPQQQQQRGRRVQIQTGAGRPSQQQAAGQGSGQSSRQSPAQSAEGQRVAGPGEDVSR
jgi:HSP20 family protein